MQGSGTGWVEGHHRDMAGHVGWDRTAAAAALRAPDEGRYEFLCTVPGHAAGGMRGELVVTAARWGGGPRTTTRGADMMWWGSGYGWIWMLLSWAVIIGLVIWAVNTFARDARARDGSSARRILDERFARGEIDEEDYRRRRDELER
jgi:putative membrane protein